MSRTPVGPGTRVELKFAIKLENGEVVDSTGDTPAVFEVGDGKLLPGFEQAIFGLKDKDSRSVLIEADRGFGAYEQENVQLIPRSQFPADGVLSEGLMFSFADPQNTELPGVITGFEGDRVCVDFNHPLAGRNLIFEVEIMSVQQISLEILRV